MSLFHQIQQLMIDPEIVFAVEPSEAETWCQHWEKTKFDFPPSKIKIDTEDICGCVFYCAILTTMGAHMRPNSCENDWSLTNMQLLGPIHTHTHTFEGIPSNEVIKCFLFTKM